MRPRSFAVRELTRSDRAWVSSLLSERWGAKEIVSRGRLRDASELPGFAAVDSGRPIGLVTYAVEGDSCELVTLDSLAEGAGVGSALLEAAVEVARAGGCRRLWLITTNDNLPALRFYQKRGFRLAAVHRDALAESRRLKPSLPPVGRDGIPLRDEFELELQLSG